MSELKIACPKCGGHVEFPKEMAGQAANCPHCQEAIILGPRRRLLLWSLLSFLFLCVIVGSAAALWHLGKGRAAPVLLQRPQLTKASEKKETAGPPEAAASEDDRAIETLCRAMYDGCTQRNFASMHQLLTTSCRAAVTAAELGDAFSAGGATYRFVALESITYPEGASGRLARARFRRAVFDTNGESEGEREFKCVKQPEGWRLFRDAEWAEKILTQFARSGFSEEVRTNVQNFCVSNPFEKWPANVTNAFEKMYESVRQETSVVFPWNLAFSVTTNYVQGNLLKLGFSVRNEAAHAWEIPGLRLELKQNGKVVLEGFQLLSRLGAGTEVRREEFFFL